jgi:hypothetical protein
MENDENNNNNNNNNTTKQKRIRRSNQQIKDKNYKCPFCEKRYSSSAALTTHKKSKHYLNVNNTDEKNEDQSQTNKDKINKNDKQNETIIAQKQYISFLDTERRRPQSNEKEISLDLIKQYIKEGFFLYKDIMYIKREKVEDYPLYKTLIEMWENEKPKIEYDSTTEEIEKQIKNKMEHTSNNKSVLIDKIFCLYLKELSKLTNNEYFIFIIKFIILFREYLNESKKDINDINKEYTTMKNGNLIPEYCNDFFNDFLEMKNYFNLDRNEFIELVHHFCYWLYDNNFAPAHLSIIK